MQVSIYLSIYLYMCIYIYISLSLYIYMYTHIVISPGAARRANSPSQDSRKVVWCSVVWHN